MSRVFNAKRIKPKGPGMLRTTPFVAAGILSMVLYYSESQTGFQWDWSRDGMILMIFTFLTITVYFAVSHQLPYSKKDIINDLLIATHYQLGTHYRINIMVLKTAEENAFDSFFKMEYGHGYDDPSKYKRKIRLETRGASDAWKQVESIYLPKADLDLKIDSQIKHLWSSPIIDRRGSPIAVLNIDNIADDTLPDELIQNLKVAVRRLADLVGFYWGIPG